MSRRQRILVDVHDLYIAKTGIRTYIESIIQSLSTLGSEYELVILPRLGKVERTSFYHKKGILQSIAFHLHTLLWKQVWLPILCKRHKIDYLLCPDYYAPAWPLDSLKKLVVFHDSLFWDRPEQYNSLWLAYFRRVIVWGLSGQTSILTVSKSSAAKLKRVLGARHHIQHLYTPVECTHEETSGSEKNLAASAPYFLHVGVIERRKGIPFLVRCLQELHKDPQLQSLRLVIVGNRSTKKGLDDYDTLVSTIQELGLQQKVELRGYVSLEELEALYRRAICLLFPSKDEGFGLPILEAFCRGLPVIASNIPALVEIGDDAVMIADPEDLGDWVEKMRKMALDEDMRSSLQRLGAARLEHFTTATFIQGFKEILQS